MDIVTVKVTIIWQAKSINDPKNLKSHHMKSERALIDGKRYSPKEIESVTQYNFMHIKLWLSHSTMEFSPLMQSLFILDISILRVNWEYIYALEDILPLHERVLEH